MKTKFKQSPGVVFDWVSMMSLKLNEQSKWVNHVVAADHEEEDLRHIEYWMDQYPQPDDHLRLFFYLPNRVNYSCFMDLFKMSMEQIQWADAEDALLEWIKDANMLKDMVSKYYLKRLIRNLPVTEIAEAIQQTNLPGEIQFLMLEFFMAPEPFVDALQKCCNQYQKITEEIHRQYLDKTVKWQENLTEQDFEKCYSYFQPNKRGRGRRRQLLNQEDITYSASLIMKNAIVFQVDKVNNWFILGKDFDNVIQLHDELSVSAGEIGNAIGDKNRLAIMEYILDEGEKSSGDVAKMLGIALNTASYHLDIMKRAKLLNYKNKGKTTYYWVNSQACQAASEIFARWAKGEK